MVSPRTTEVQNITLHSLGLRPWPAMRAVICWPQPGAWPQRQPQKHSFARRGLWRARRRRGRAPSRRRCSRGRSDKCVAAGKPPPEIVTYPDRPIGIRMLLNDRADLLMGDAGGNARTIKLYPNELESGFVILTDYRVGPGISKSLPEMRQAIFDSMHILQGDRVQKALMVKYGVDPELQRPVEMHTK